MNKGIVLIVLLGLRITVAVASETPAPPDEPYLYHEVKAWHDRLGSEHWVPLPRELAVDLNGDGLEARFLLVQGFSRGGIYVLFAYHDSMWHSVSNRIIMSHLPLRILETSHDGWKDFLTYVPRGNGSEVVETRYILSGKGYIEESSRTLDWEDVKAK